MKLQIAKTITIVLIISGCGQISTDTSKESEKNISYTSNDSINNNSIVNSETEKVITPGGNQKIAFNIPSPSGPGTGVCEVSLHIENNFIEAIQTCGGHDENGRFETSDKLFKVALKENHKYKVSKLINISEGNSFGCEYFEIKENALYLYDENQKIVNEWFCTFGNTIKEVTNQEACDCVFLPTQM